MTAPRRPDDYNRRPAKDERAYGQRNEDAYQSRGKYPEPSVCTGCGAVYAKGHWNWSQSQEGAHKHLCPACQRVHDRVAAGIVTIKGEFFAEHRQEILNLIHNLEAKEKAEHTLQRIMNITSDNGRLVIALTDFHITKGLIEALKNAYQGESQLEFVDKDGVLRGFWHR